MKKSVKLAVAGLAAVAVVGGTFAYWQADSVIDNKFNTKGFGGQTTEVFNPLDGQDWKPGAKVDKEVGVTNTGDYPIVARISFNEEWTQNDVPMIGYPMSSIKDGAKNADFFPNQGDEYDAEKSVVVKNLLLSSGDWVDGGDGYYYTANPIAVGGKTANLLTSVEMLNDTPMAVYTDAKGNSKTVSTITVQKRKADGSPIVGADGKPVKDVYENATMEVTEGGEGTSTYQQVTIKQNGTVVANIVATDNAVITREAEQELVSAGFSNAKYSLKIHTEYSQVATNEDGTTKMVNGIPVGMLWDTATTN